MKKNGLLRHGLVAVLATIMMTGTVTTVFAGEWKQDATGWWWQNDDGSYPTNCWEWIDGNKDGVAECYYFGADGYMLAGTTTPDGYTVNADGAWMENGEVRTQETDAMVDEDENEDEVDMSDKADCYSTDEYDPETGFSLAALDMLRNNNRELNAKYGEVSAERKGNFHPQYYYTNVVYENGLCVRYHEDGYVEYVTAEDGEKYLDPTFVDFNMITSDNYPYNYSAIDAYLNGKGYSSHHIWFAAGQERFLWEKKTSYGTVYLSFECVMLRECN